MPGTQTSLLSPWCLDKGHHQETSWPQKLPWQTDLYPLLLFHMGDDQSVTCSSRAIERNFRSLGYLLKESRIQVLSLLPLVGKDTVRNRRTQSIDIGFVTDTNAIIFGRFFLITGWPTWHWACSHQIAFTSLKEGRGFVGKS